ncbi:long-chain-fatty-acid--CoA ligase [Calycomorphotria hydatis]|uniref:Long-chain-fatty-acid--CoA ligase n=1 Tax=Calycomorphotria hydatis TaxID=2528027 RepID=A0A517T9G7_9PLAN|nr:long-chain fatty acid--CoA ligase [Calycomorphotria hydatis]QDT64999.1 Long-chain-fatty-acid--CoA ligase [Calycomorphotria hydatis]
MSRHASPNLRSVGGEWPSSTYYPKGVPRKLNYPEMPAWGYLQQSAERAPERTAIIYGDTCITYEELWDRSCRAASFLIDLGIKPGDRVGLMLPNTPEYIVALHGVWLCGAVAVSVSPLMVDEEVSRVLEMTECKAVIGLDMLADRLMNGTVNPLHSVFVSLIEALPGWKQFAYYFERWRRTGQWYLPTNEHFHWLNDELLQHEPLETPVVVKPKEDPAFILPTSGTTGDFKAVVLTHYNIVANAWQQANWQGKTLDKEVFMAVLPFFHCYGLSAVLLTGMSLGATLILHHKFSVRKVLDLIAEHQPTIFHAVPLMLVKLNEELRKKEYDLSSLKCVITGGASLPRDTAQEFSKHSGAIVVEGYGLSEASPVTHVGPLDGHSKPEMIGLPLPDTEARIVDAETGKNELPMGEVGELIVRGPQVMKGYLNNQAATEYALRDGWLFTGDLAIQDEDGFFKIVDRKKDLIITGGFNVYPGEVEAALLFHPAVLDVAVVGVPDHDRGEIVKAFVKVRHLNDITDEEMADHCMEHLSRYKIPREFEFMTGELPRNFLGKVLRRVLRKSQDDQESSSTKDEEKHTVTQ